MALTSFTSNVTDHSTENGFQFEFHCDKCGNGVMTSFIASKVGVAGGLLRAASSFFGGGGLLGGAAQASDYLRDQTRGKARDDAFAKAVEEARPKFKQCSRCGSKVCPEHCWNHERGLCETCAPDLQEEMASAQASVAKEQMWEKLRAGNALEDVKMTAGRTATCPHCGAKATGGKFCGDCGKSLQSKRHCTDCGAKVEAAAKFCPECGSKA
ncbi:MAG TPA: zinc ribbon domain-containing protein [Tepidisphaeraceae bacterium]|jgi:hypothetical protein